MKLRETNPNKFFEKTRPKETIAKVSLILKAKGNITHMCLIKCTMVEGNEYCTFLSVCVLDPSAKKKKKVIKVLMEIV